MTQLDIYWQNVVHNVYDLPADLPTLRLLKGMGHDNGKDLPANWLCFIHHVCGYLDDRSPPPSSGPGGKDRSSAHP